MTAGARQRKASAPAAAEGAAAVAPAAPASPDPAAETRGRLRVACRADPGRWRGGRFWPRGTTEVDAGDLSEEALARLMADPAFDVTMTGDAG